MKAMIKAMNCSRGKLLLMLSGAAFLALTTPAWGQGLVAACGILVLLCLAVLTLPATDGEILDLMQPGFLAAGLVTAGIFGVNFYNTWLDSSYVALAARLLGAAESAVVFCVAAVGVLAAMPAVSCVLSWMTRAGKAAFRGGTGSLEGKYTVSAGRAFAILTAVYVLGILALLRTNFYYMDDNGRAAFGYKDWDYFGRYLSTALASLLHMDNFLSDIAPLPQLTAMVMMAAASVLLLNVLYDRDRFALWELAAVLPLGLNPYFLECLSFRFDAPYMAVSVLAGILPLLYRNKGTCSYLLVCMLGILAVCTSYQPAAGIFPMTVILLALRMWLRGTDLKDAAVFGLKSAAGYGMGLVYFKLVIMKPADSGYVSNALPSVKALVPNAAGNLKDYYSLIGSDFQPLWLVLTVLTAAAAVFLLVRGSRRKTLPALALTAVCAAVMAVLCFGLYPFLQTPLFSPRAMYGFGVLLALVCCVAAEGRGAVSCRVPALLLSWAFFVFSFTYGNALSLQKDYTEFRLQLVMEDLNGLEVFSGEEKTVLQVTGGIGLSPVLENYPEHYSLLRRMVPESFAGGDDLSTYRFYYYYGLQDHVRHGDRDLRKENLPIVKEGIFHTIRSDGERILIELK